MTNVSICVLDNVIKTFFLSFWVLNGNKLFCIIYPIKVQLTLTYAIHTHFSSAETEQTQEVCVTIDKN